MMMGLENALVCGFGKMMFFVRGKMRMDEVENNGLVRGRITFRRTGLALGHLEKLPELADYIALRETGKGSGHVMDIIGQPCPRLSNYDRTVTGQVI